MTVVYIIILGLATLAIVIYPFFGHEPATVRRTERSSAKRTTVTEEDIEKQIAARRLRKGKFCPQCGSATKAGARFCATCGTNLSGEKKND